MEWAFFWGKIAHFGRFWGHSVVSKPTAQQFLALNGRHKLLPRSVRSMITGILQFFPALVHTPASAPALIPVILKEVNCGSSDGVIMESYNLCSPSIITFEAKI